jgi:hypothetical protein
MPLRLSHLHHRSESSPVAPPSRSIHASAIPGGWDLPARNAAWRPLQHRRRELPSNHQTAKSKSTTTTAAATSSSSEEENPSSSSSSPSPSSAPYVPPPPINYFDSDAFVASPPPPESITRPAYNRYRAAIDVERSTVKGWEEVVPSAGDPDWRPPPVDLGSLAAYPVPWLRFKILPAHLTFLVAEVWSRLVVPLWHLLRRSWVVTVAAGIDRKVFGKARRRRRRRENGEEASPPSSSSSPPSSASSLSVLELALQRWHGKRTPLDDLGDWVLGLRGT